MLFQTADSSETGWIPEQIFPEESGIDLLCGKEQSRFRLGSAFALTPSIR